MLFLRSSLEPPHLCLTLFFKLVSNWCQNSSFFLLSGNPSWTKRTNTHNPTFPRRQHKVQILFKWLCENRRMSIFVVLHHDKRGHDNHCHSRRRVCINSCFQGQSAHLTVITEMVSCLHMDAESHPVPPTHARALTHTHTHTEQHVTYTDRCYSHANTASRQHEHEGTHTNTHAENRSGLR